jgi:hypothetical protein
MMMTVDAIMMAGVVIYVQAAAEEACTHHKLHASLGEKR